MKPSDFTMQPYNSVLQKSEAETIAANIMVILKRTGDEFRELGWDEYKAERLKDGRFSGIEEMYFKKVIPYCKSEDTAKLFSPTWNNIVESI